MLETFMFHWKEILAEPGDLPLFAFMIVEMLSCIGGVSFRQSFECIRLIPVYERQYQTDPC